MLRPGTVHRYGSYQRYAAPEGTSKGSPSTPLGFASFGPPAPPTKYGWPSPKLTATKCGRPMLSSLLLQHEGAPVQSRFIAFLDDASSVCCHGLVFPAENVDTLIESLC